MPNVTGSYSRVIADTNEKTSYYLDTFGDAGKLKDVSQSTDYMFPWTSTIVSAQLLVKLAVFSSIKGVQHLHIPEHRKRKSN